MSYRQKAIIFSTFICLLLLLTMTALASGTTADLQEGGAVGFSADEAKPQVVQIPAPSTSAASTVYLPILITPDVLQLDFAGSTDCSTYTTPQPAPATFTQPLKQLAVRITLDGLQGQAYTYTWYRNDTFAFNGVQNVSPAGFDVKSITLGTTCSQNLPSGVYRLDVSQLGTVILRGTATLP